MKILSVGSDKLLFEEGSKVRKRIIQYGSLVSRLTIIVFTPRGYKPIKLSHNIEVLPTNAFIKIWSFVLAYRLGKKLEKPDVVTTQDPFESGLVGLLLARYHGATLELQLHTDPFSPYFKKESLFNRIRLLVARITLSRADGVRVVSRGVEESLIAFGIPKAKIVVLPIFVEKEKGEEKAVLPVSFSHITLMVSRLTKEKNIPQAIKAFKEALAENSEAGLIIVGDGRERKLLEKLASDLLIKDSVVFVGWQEKTAPWYKVANVYLLTSLYEGFGRTLIEAALYNVPTISTPVGIAQDVGAEVVTLEKLPSLLQEVVSGRKIIPPAHLPLGWYVDENDYLQRIQKSWERLAV
jgi:glycosyltransferase involved in cell wall biosynthesis